MEIESGANWARVCLSGEVDLGWAEDHKDEFDLLCQAEHTSVVVDLGAVTFMDSTGLALIARLCQVCRNHGGVLYIVRPSKTILKAMGIVGLTEVSEVVVAETADEIAAVDEQLAALTAQAS